MEEKKEMSTSELINTIADCAKLVRSKLTPGFEEKVYRNAMLIELMEHGVEVETEVPFRVYYKDHIVGEYRADMIVEQRVIVELKAVTSLSVIHEVQLVNYLTATGINDGILINFGGDVIEIKPKTRVYRRKNTSAS